MQIFQEYGVLVFIPRRVRLMIDWVEFNVRSAHKRLYGTQEEFNFLFLPVLTFHGIKCTKAGTVIFIWLVTFSRGLQEEEPQTTNPMP